MMKEEKMGTYVAIERELISSNERGVADTIFAGEIGQNQVPVSKHTDAEISRPTQSRYYFTDMKETIYVRDGNGAVITPIYRPSILKRLKVSGMIVVDRYSLTSNDNTKDVLSEFYSSKTIGDEMLKNINNALGRPNVRELGVLRTISIIDKKKILLGMVYEPHLNIGIGVNDIPGVSISEDDKSTKIEYSIINNEESGKLYYVRVGGEIQIIPSRKSKTKASQYKVYFHKPNNETKTRGGDLKDLASVGVYPTAELAELDGRLPLTDEELKLQLEKDREELEIKKEERIEKSRQSLAEREDEKHQQTMEKLEISHKRDMEAKDIEIEKLRMKNKNDEEKFQNDLNLNTLTRISDMISKEVANSQKIAQDAIVHDHAIDRDKSKEAREIAIENHKHDIRSETQQRQLYAEAIALGATASKALYDKYLVKG